MNTNISRRKLLATTPAAFAAVATPAIASQAVVPEHPWVKARRLASELSQCLSEGDDDWGSGPGGEWLAEVYPAGSGEYCVGFGSISSREWPRCNVSFPMQQTIDAHMAALEALNNACDGIDRVKLCREPTKAARRRWDRASRAETLALSALCAAKPHGRADGIAKAAYMAKIGRKRLLDDLSLDDILALANSAVSL